MYDLLIVDFHISHIPHITLNKRHFVTPYGVLSPGSPPLLLWPWKLIINNAMKRASTPAIPNIHHDISIRWANAIQFNVIVVDGGLFLLLYDQK